MVALENVIGRSIEEALSIANEILKRKLTLAETRKIVGEQKEKVERMHIKATVKVLPKLAPKPVSLETPGDFEKAAKVLKKIAKKRQEKALTPEEKAREKPRGSGRERKGGKLNNAE